MRHPVDHQNAIWTREMIRRGGHAIGWGSLVSVRHRGQLSEPHQLYFPNGRQLRILEAGHGATNDDIGKFWFVLGYSELDGPDIIQT